MGKRGTYVGYVHTFRCLLGFNFACLTIFVTVLQYFYYTVIASRCSPRMLDPLIFSLSALKLEIVCQFSFLSPLLQESNTTSILTENKSS